MATVTEETGLMIVSLIGQGNTEAGAIDFAALTFKVTPDTIRRRYRHFQAANAPREAAATKVPERRIKELETALATAKQHAVTAERVSEWITGVKELADPLPAERDPKRFRRESESGEEFLNLCLSDWHVGEVVDPAQVFDANAYDMEIAEQRVAKSFDKAHWLGETYLGKRKFNRMTVFLGGDIISGNIHLDLEATNEKQIMWQVAEATTWIVQGLRFYADEYEEVDVYGVAGNHGRSTMKPRMKDYAATSFDWLIYLNVAAQLKAAGISNIFCHFPPARDMTIEVGGHRYRLTHGDQFKGGDGIIGSIGPVMRGHKRKVAQAASLPGGREMYQTMIVGHWHNYWTSPRVIQNGSLSGFSELSLLYGFDYEPPTQALWVTHPAHGIIYHAPVMP